MATLFLDLETYSEVPLTRGTHPYAAAAEIIILGWAWDTEPARAVEWGDKARSDLIDMLAEATDVVIHRSAFDRTILHHQGIQLPAHLVQDTMVLAQQHSLPGGLDKLCDILKVPTDKAKAKDGKALIQLFCKPRKPTKKHPFTRATKHTHPQEWARFMEYARLDIEAMREVYLRLPRWNATEAEHALWVLDQTINERGIAIDLEHANSAREAAINAKLILAERGQDMTNGHVLSLTQGARLMEYLSGRGTDMPDLKKGTIAGMLKGGVDKEVEDILEARLEAATASPAKYKSLALSTSSDGRLRDTLTFCGAARTGRWGGRLFQPHNLPRPSLPNELIDIGIDAMKLGCEDLLFSSVIELCVSAIRGAMVAAKGKKLVVADLSNIEGRVLAWLAGEVWKLEAYRAYDAGDGPDLYLVTAASVLGKRLEDITKDERQTSGKVPELACGYQGAVGAFTKMGANYGVELPEERVLQIVKAWRKANPNIVRFWYDLENAVKAVLTHAQERVKIAGLTVDRRDGWLRIQLPSKRYLCYKQAQLIDTDTKSGVISYMGINQYTKQWERLHTYGGKLAENVTQAIARDILVEGMKKAEQHGYDVVMHVHDELITEVPDGNGYTPQELSALMVINPPWAAGLPLAAAGFETKRYRKG